MKRLLLAFGLAIFSCILPGRNALLATVPEQMQFCDLELNLDADARAKIEEIIAKIKRSPTHFQQLVDRANMYFPFIDEAFDLRGVPEDLKYIVIQESGLSSDVVSTSNAVGFWQFKVESARESGLVIDEFVDERKHIFQSSLAAAKYFYSIARYYDNYIYAVIGYNRGPVGAIAYTDENNYGRRRMTVTGETHWYALHALANKLAFEDIVGKTDPPVWLQPMNSRGETDVARLAASQGIALDEFKRFNTWINGTTLPPGRDFIYYLPRKGKFELALLRQVGGNGKQIAGPTVVKPIEKPITKPIEAPIVAPKEEVVAKLEVPRDNRKFDYLEQALDPDYGVEYARMKPGESLVEVAVHNRVKIKRLQQYNDFTNYHRPNGGDIVYLKTAKSRRFHIVVEGETLSGIAEHYLTTEDELRKKNRINGNAVFAGQKLSLKKRVSKGQKPILLVPIEEIDEVTPVVQPLEEERVTPLKTKPREVMPAGKGIMETDPAIFRLPAFDSKIITHIVGPNESLWKIARKYGAFAEVIKKLNHLSSTELKQGQQLKVLQVIDRL